MKRHRLTLAKQAILVLTEVEMPRTATAAATAEFTARTGGQWLPVVAIWWDGILHHYAAEPITRPITAQARLMTVADVEEMIDWTDPVQNGNWSCSLQDADLALRAIIDDLPSPGLIGQRVQLLLWSRKLAWSDALVLFDGEIESGEFDATTRMWDLTCRSVEQAMNRDVLPIVDKQTFPKLGCPGENTAHIPLVYGNPCYRVPAVLIGRPGRARLSTDLQLWQENLYIDRDAADGGFSLDGETTLAIGYPGNYELVTGSWVGSDDDDTEDPGFEPRTRFVIRSRTRWWARGDALGAGRGYGSLYSPLYFAAIPTGDLPSTDAAGITGRVLYFRDDYENSVLQNGAPIVWRSMLSMMALVRNDYSILGYTRPDIIREHWRYSYVISSVQGIDPIWPAGTPVMLVNPSTLTNPFSTIDGETSVTVAWTRHGLTAGDVVRFAGSNPIAGLELDGVLEVAQVLNDDEFVIVASEPANGTGTGGGTVTYWTRPEAGNNGYWKYAINAVPSVGIDRVEARGQITPAGGGTTQPVWYTLNPDEYDIQLDDRSHNEDLGRDPDDDPGLTTISLARPLTTYGTLDAVPYVTLRGPATVETVDEQDPDDVVVAEKPGDVVRHLLSTEVISGLAATQWDGDAITAAQDVLDADPDRDVTLAFALREQVKLIDTLKLIALQSTLIGQVRGREFRLDAVDEFEGLTADDSTASVATLRTWSETENEPPVSRMRGQIKQYSEGDALPVNTLSPGVEAAYGRDEQTAEWTAYQSLLQARRAQQFWHQHLLDRQRVVELQRFGDALLSVPTDAIGGTGLAVPLPGQLREQQITVAPLPSIRQKLDSRVWVWDDLSAIDVDDERCLEPPSTLWNPQAPQAWNFGGQGETLDLNYTTPLAPGDACACAHCVEGLEFTLAGLPDVEIAYPAVGPEQFRFNLADANGTWLSQCIDYPYSPSPLTGGGYPRYKTFAPVDVDTTGGAVIRIDVGEFSSNFGFFSPLSVHVSAFLPGTSVRAVTVMRFHQPSGGEPKFCTSVAQTYLRELRETGTALGVPDQGSLTQLEMLGCCLHPDLPSGISRFTFDLTGYTAGKWNDVAISPLLCRVGGVDIQLLSNGLPLLVPPVWSEGPADWGGCEVISTGAEYVPNGNPALCMTAAVGTDGRFYIILGVRSFFGAVGFVQDTHWKDIVAIYGADSVSAVAGASTTLDLEWRNTGGADWSDPDPTGGYPATADFTAVACRTLADAVNDQK